MPDSFAAPDNVVAVAYLTYECPCIIGIHGQHKYSRIKALQCNHTKEHVNSVCDGCMHTYKQHIHVRTVADLKGVSTS